MSYNTYLLVLSQLSTRKKAQCVVQDSVIFIESNPQDSRWNLATKLLDSDQANIPSYLKESLSKKGLLRWQERGAYLKLDPESNHVYLIQEINSSKKYIPFRSVMNDFAGLAKEWKEILSEGTIREDSFLRLG
jgi:hypothetical protein